MSFLGLRGSRPVATPFAGLTTDTKIDHDLDEAVQRHKETSTWVIGRSLDVVDHTEQVRLSLEAIVTRKEVAGIPTAQGAFELISRGHDGHHP